MMEDAARSDGRNSPRTLFVGFTVSRSQKSEVSKPALGFLNPLLGESDPGEGAPE